MEKEINIEETLKLILQKLDNQDTLKLILHKLDNLEDEIRNVKTDYEKRITRLEDDNWDVENRVDDLEAELE